MIFSTFLTSIAAATTHSGGGNNISKLSNYSNTARTLVFYRLKVSKSTATFGKIVADVGNMPRAVRKTYLAVRNGLLTLSKTLLTVRNMGLSFRKTYLEVRNVPLTFSKTYLETGNSSLTTRNTLLTINTSFSVVSFASFLSKRELSTLCIHSLKS